MPPRIPQSHETAGNAARRRLSLLLRSGITRGDFPEGRLPRESEIMRDYGASRGVVRDVLQQLHDTGVVTRTHGVGTRSPLGSGPRPYPLRGDGLPAPRDVQRQIIDTPRTVEERLNGCGPRVLRIEYLATVDDIASAVSTNYLALPTAAILSTVDLGGGIHDLLRDGGLPLSSTEHVISAMLADTATARRLGVAPSSPLLRLEQTMRDRTGAALSFSITAMRPDQLSLFVETVELSSRTGDRPLSASSMA